MIREKIMNMEKGWVGLSEAKNIKRTPLANLTEDNLWIKASLSTFRSHLRRVALAQSPNWFFLIKSDAELMDAWLIDIPDEDVFDADVGLVRWRREKAQFHSLSELVEPPRLLVVALGFKRARNSAMPEVMAEVIQLREFSGRPLWIIDNPAYPFTDGHLTFSAEVQAMIESWKALDLVSAASASSSTGNGKSKKNTLGGN